LVSDIAYAYPCLDLKDRWLRGQSFNTKALNLLSTLHKKISAAMEEYLKAISPLLVLGDLIGEKNVDKVF
jgi:hypothetical protein